MDQNWHSIRPLSAQRNQVSFRLREARQRPRRARPPCCKLGGVVKESIHRTKRLVTGETSRHTRPLSADKRGGKIMFHLLWYIVVGLVAGVIAKSVMHVHMTIFWTIVLGIIGSIIGGGLHPQVFHRVNRRIFFRPPLFFILFAALGFFLFINIHICFSPGV